MTKVIDNFPNYSISDDGVITNLTTGHIKKLWECKNGYLYVDLQHKGYRSKFPLHRLLATHFLPNPNQKRTVNHIDGNKLNNSLSNLEWATYSENMQHAYDTSLNHQPRKTSADEADNLFLTRVITGTTITALAAELHVSVSQLSYRIKEASIRLDMEIEYTEELRRQKLLRQYKVK